jgi:hypothetical protein
MSLEKGGGGMGSTVLRYVNVWQLAGRDRSYI